MKKNIQIIIENYIKLTDEEKEIAEEINNTQLTEDEKKKKQTLMKIRVR